MHDNPVLNWAVKNSRPGTQVLPVFCFDPRFFTNAVPEFQMARKSGVHRTRFAIESVADLRTNLQQVGSGLLVAQAKPEDFLPQLVHPERHTTIVFSAETCSEERSVEDKLEKAMKAKGECRFVDLWGNTLCHIDDIPERMWDRFPSSATAFMRMTDNINIRPALPSPQHGQLPSMEPSSDVEANALDFTPDLIRDF